MIVGICWPTPGPQGSMDPGFLKKLARTRATHLRVDLDYRNPNAAAIVEQAREAGFEVLPVLDLDYDHVELQPYLDFCQQIVEAHRFPAVEILNEPRILHGWSPDKYAQVFTAASERIRQLTRVVIAGDFLKADRNGPNIDSWFSRVKVPEDSFDAVAIHTYRNPGRPSATKNGTRRKEHGVWQRQARGKPMIVTEVGWQPTRGMDEHQMGDCIIEELLINEALGIEATYVYAHMQDPSRDFGLFRTDQTPRPAAFRIAQFQGLHGAVPPPVLGAMATVSAASSWQDWFGAYIPWLRQPADPQVAVPPRPAGWTDDVGGIIA
jgi:hypothetical protein